MLRAPRAERGGDPAGADRSRVRRREHRRHAPTPSSCPTRCSSPSTTPKLPPARATASASRSCSRRSPARSRAGRLPRAFRIRFYTPIAHLLDALLASYRDWGGTAKPPRMAIVDWREVPTWSEFELLRDAFVAAGVPTLVCDPRDLVFDGRALTAGGERIDFVYRRVLINDIVARPTECKALIDAYRAKARLRRQHAALQDSPQEGVLRGADRRSLRLTFQRRRARARRRARPVDAGRRRDGAPTTIRRRREMLVLKPNDEYGGTGVTLAGRPASASGMPRSTGTGGGQQTRACGSRRSASTCGARPFPSAKPAASSSATCWWTSRPMSSAGGSPAS